MRAFEKVSHFDPCSGAQSSAILSPRDTIQTLKCVHKRLDSLCQISYLLKMFEAWCFLPKMSFNISVGIGMGEARVGVHVT